MADVSVDHLFIKALAKAGVQFPISKAEIKTKLGDITLRLSETNKIKAASLVEGIKPDYFDNGASFFCAYHSALYDSTWRKAFLKGRA
jgi:hypothetical protein